MGAKAVHERYGHQTQPANSVSERGNMDFRILTLAYLDPGTGSMLLQALVGGSSGLFVLIRHLWKTFHNKPLSESVQHRLPGPDPRQ